MIVEVTVTGQWQLFHCWGKKSQEKLQSWGWRGDDDGESCKGISFREEDISAGKRKTKRMLQTLTRCS